MKLTTNDLRKIQELKNRVYARNPAGCCWHVVLDDGNVNNDSVRFCAEVAIENNHLDCMMIAPILMYTSKTQRLKLINDGYNHLLKVE